MFTPTEMQEKTYPDIAYIPGYLKSADNDDVKARDTRKLMALLNRMRQSNPRIAGHLITRKTAYSSYRWQIRTGENRFDPLDITARCTGLIKSIINNYVNAAAFGMFALEIERTVADGARFVVRKSLPPTSIDHQDDTLLIIDDANVKTSIDTNDVTYFWYKYPNDYRGGFLRSIIYPELLRHMTLVEWSNLNLRMKGIILALVDPENLQNYADTLNLSEEEYSTVLKTSEQALKNVGNNTYAQLPNAINIEMKSLVEGAAGGSFAEFKNQLDKDIAIAILGQANTSELPDRGGSRAALQVLNLIRQDILFDDMQKIKDICDRALLLDFRANYDKNADETPYEFEWIHDDTPDIEAYARVFETLSRIGNIDVEIDEFYSKLGLRRPENGGETMQLKTDNGIM